ncbi:MAG: DNA-directed RNA polymerase subunit A'', partial [Halobacteriales archaeon]
MSVDGTERVLIRQDGETAVRQIGPFVDEVLDRSETRSFDGHEVARGPQDLEVLSLRSDEQVEWKPVEEVSRHEAPEDLLDIELESGRSIRATDNHSFVIKKQASIVPVSGDDLTDQDELPVVGKYDQKLSRADFSSQRGNRNQAATDGGLVTERDAEVRSVGIDTAAWERIDSIEPVTPSGEHVYDLSVAGLETFTTGQGIVTHNTMNTFHYAGVAEIDVTQGLPRLIELVDARKTPDTPMMSIYLDDEHATDREKAHEVVWKLEATRILALGDVSTNVADMLVRIDLNPETLEERQITAEEVAETIESHLDVDTALEDTVIEFGPDEPSYRQLLQLVEQLRDIVFKGLEEVSRVVIRKEQREDTEDEFVLYTEGSDFGTALDIEGVDATRSTTNNIHEVH